MSQTAQEDHYIVIKKSDLDADTLEALSDFIVSYHVPQCPSVVDDLTESLKGLMAIVNDSQGVAGYHLNGDVAEWDEFTEVSYAQNALANVGGDHRDK